MTIAAWPKVYPPGMKAVPGSQLWFALMMISPGRNKEGFVRGVEVSMMALNGSGKLSLFSWHETRTRRKRRPDPSIRTTER